MKVLLFSDLHAHAFRAYSTILPNGRNSRLQDAINILEEIGRIATEESVDGILFAGDLFHIRPGLGTMKITTFNAVYDAIARLKIGRSFVGLLVGNHDQGDRAGKEHSIYAFGSIVDVVMDQPAWYSFYVNPRTTNEENLLVFAVPAQGDLRTVKDTIESNWNDENEGGILLGHLPIAGASTGCNFRMPADKAPNVQDLLPDKFHRIFLGDYHKPQTLQTGVQYIGATHHHNWGDADQRRGCLIWDTEADTVTFHHLTSAPHFEKVPLETWAKHIAEGGATNNIIRILHTSSIPGNLRDQIVEQYTSLGARSVEFQEDTPSKEVISSSSKFQPAMDHEDMISNFVQRESPDDLEEDLLMSIGRGIMNKAAERSE